MHASGATTRHHATRRLTPPWDPELALKPPHPPLPNKAYRETPLRSRLLDADPRIFIVELGAARKHERHVGVIGRGLGTAGRVERAVRRGALSELAVARGGRACDGGGDARLSNCDEPVQMERYWCAVRPFSS